MTTCRYPTKRKYITRDRARAGARKIRAEVESLGGLYTKLYPYRCPVGGHWHLSSSRQGFRVCWVCDTRQPAWFDRRRREWVIYAHGQCSTLAVPR